MNRAIAMLQRYEFREHARLLKWIMTIPTAGCALLIVSSVFVHYRVASPNGDTFFIGDGRVYQRWGGWYRPKGVDEERPGLQFADFSRGEYDLARSLGLWPINGERNEWNAVDPSNPPASQAHKTRGYQYIMLTPPFLPFAYATLCLWFADRRPLKRRRWTAIAFWVCNGAALAVVLAGLTSFLFSAEVFHPLGHLRCASGTLCYDDIDFRSANHPGVTQLDGPFGLQFEFQYLPPRSAQLWPRILTGWRQLYVEIPLWLLLFVCALPAAAIWIRGWQTNEPQCDRCGYNLTGNLSGRCPECGTQVQKQV